MSQQWFEVLEDVLGFTKGTKITPGVVSQFGDASVKNHSTSLIISLMWDLERVGKLKKTESPAEEADKERPGSGFAMPGQEPTPEEAKAITPEQLKENYDRIIRILKEFVIMREDYYPIIALWIIGTYIHKEFECFPFLFINAMKGSGKSRLLKLMSALSYNGKVMASMSEAVLFRTATEGTIFIDEAEHIGSKEKGTLRELLDAAYKKGTKVERMRKKKVEGEEVQVVESFDLYCPIALANIWGMEEVLGDRCIQLTLEKSNSCIVTKLIEDFADNYDISVVKTTFQCSLCSVVTIKNITTAWNNYIKNKYKTTLTTHTTHTTQNYINYTSLFDMIDETEIEGRNLELFFPLLLIARAFDEGVLKEVIRIAVELVHEKKIEEKAENKDIALIEYVSIQTNEGFVSISTITIEFKAYLFEDDDEIKWLNSKWVGRALKRLGLIKDKRRMGRGIEVMLAVEKAKSKNKMFEPKKIEEEKVEEHHSKEIPQQERVMICLNANGDPIDATAISKILSIPEEEVQKCLDKLEKEGEIFQPKSGYYKVMD